MKGLVLHVHVYLGLKCVRTIPVIGPKKHPVGLIHTQEYCMHAVCNIQPSALQYTQLIPDKVPRTQVSSYLLIDKLSHLSMLTSLSINK